MFGLFSRLANSADQALREFEFFFFSLFCITFNLKFSNKGIFSVNATHFIRHGFSASQIKAYS